MRVLVTGGAGLIGSHLVDDLLSHDYDVVVLDNLDPEVHPNGRPSWLSADIRFVHGDLRDPSSLDQALEGCEGVFHLAAYGGFTPEFSKIADVNCTGTSRLHEAIRRSGKISKIVAASSMAVYGEGWYACPTHGAFHGSPRHASDLAKGLWEVRCGACGCPAAPSPISESSGASPATVYASSKYFTERSVLSEGRELGIGAVALRYFLTFGPRQSVHNPYSGICSIFSTRLLNGLPPVVYEDGRQTRDIVFVEDVARATRVAFEHPGADGRVFNVSRGESVSIAGFAQLLATTFDVEIEPECGRRFRPMDNRHMLGDASSIRALGWSPSVELADGVARYVEWVRELNDVAEVFGAAEARLRSCGVVRNVASADD